MTLRFNADCCCASTLSSGYRCKNTQGFTLIETMVTLVLLALLMGLVMPMGISSVDRANSRSELIELRRFVSYAREYAYNRGRTLELRFDGTSVTSKERPATSGQRSAPRGAALKPQTFQTLFFSPQTVIVNELGFVNVNEVTYQSQGRQGSLKLVEMGSGKP